MGFTSLKNNAINTGSYGGFEEIKIAQMSLAVHQVFSRPLDIIKEVTVTGTAEQQYNRSLLKLSGHASGTSSMQTIKTLRYISGQTIEAGFTLAPSRQLLAGESLIGGCFTSNNGMFMGWFGNEFKCGYRNVEQGADVLSPAIDVELTPLQMNRFRIRYGYLGVGNIEYSVKLANKWEVIHVFETDGNLSERTHTGEPITPMRIELNSTDASLYSVSGCCYAGVYGELSGHEKPSQDSISRVVNTVNNGDQLPICAWRSKTTFGLYENMIQTQLTTLEIANDQTGMYAFKILSYPQGTITTGTWANTNAWTVIEKNPTVSAIPAGGIEIFSTAVAGTNQTTSSGKINVKDLKLISSPGDEFLLIKECILKGNGTGQVFATLSWDDLI